MDPRHEFLFQSVEVPIEKIVTQIQYVNVTQYEFLFQSVEVPIEKIVNVTQYEFLFQSVEVPIEKIVTQIQYVNVTVEVPIEKITTDACLAYLLETFLETLQQHWQIFITFVMSIVAAICSVAAFFMGKLVYTAPNGWPREIFQFFVPAFTSLFFSFGNFCLQCQLQNLMTLFQKLFASYAPFCYFAGLLFVLGFSGGTIYQEISDISAQKAKATGS